MAIWNQFRSILFGGAIGAAARTAIEPQIEPARQLAWANNRNRILELGALAELVAEGAVTEGDVDELVGRNGYQSASLRALTEIALHAPDLNLLMTSRRRKEISAEQFDDGLAKLRIKPAYRPAIRKLLDVRLSPDVLAAAIVRGLIPDPGILPVGPPTGTGNVPRFPVFNVDAEREAADAGLDLERLSVLVGNYGRPMSPEAAAAGVFKGILERVDFDRAIAEGDVRNEWAESIFENQRQIPSVADYVAARIRGWITTAEMNEGVARHGMSPADAHLLYLRTGRPAAPGQMATAAARGIDGPDGVPMNREQFLKGIAESDIRPEWGPMLWDTRYLYPPLFQLGRLVAAGAIDADTAADWATKDRYPPEVVTALHAFWSQPSTQAASPWANRARSRLFTVAHNEFLDFSLDEAGARAVLAQVGASDPEADTILELWQTERGIARLELTPAQVKKAYTKALYTEATALAELQERGMSPEDAATYLAE